MSHIKEDAEPVDVKKDDAIYLTVTDDVELSPVKSLPLGISYGYVLIALHDTLNDFVFEKSFVDTNNVNADDLKIMTGKATLLPGTKIYSKRPLYSNEEFSNSFVTTGFERNVILVGKIKLVDAEISITQYWARVFIL